MLGFELAGDLEATAGKDVQNAFVMLNQAAGPKRVECFEVSCRNFGIVEINEVAWAGPDPFSSLVRGENHKFPPLGR